MATSDTAHARCNPDDRPPTLGGHFCNLTTAAVEDGANRTTELSVLVPKVQFKATSSTIEEDGNFLFAASDPHTSLSDYAA
jgi:hypothetical protein